MPDDRATHFAAPRGWCRGVEVQRPRDLDAAQREWRTAVLEGLLGGAGTLRFDADPALIAGLRLSLGDWLLAANLRDELKGFAEAGPWS